MLRTGSRTLCMQRVRSIIELQPPLRNSSVAIFCFSSSSPTWSQPTPDFQVVSHPSPDLLNFKGRMTSSCLLGLDRKWGIQLPALPSFPSQERKPSIFSSHLGGLLPYVEETAAKFLLIGFHIVYLGAGRTRKGPDRVRETRSKWQSLVVEHVRAPEHMQREVHSQPSSNWRKYFKSGGGGDFEASWSSTIFCVRPGKWKDFFSSVLLFFEILYSLPVLVDQDLWQG